MSRGQTQPRKKRGFWRTLRIYFRRFRITVWLVILAVLVGVIYVNRVGLPGIVKKPLQQKLQANGIDLEFSRLRLRWYEGIVAENVRFGRAVENSPTITAREAKVLVNWQALLHGRVQVDSLLVRDGRLAWPISETNEPARELVLSGIYTQLRLLPNDQWLLDHFQAVFADADIRLSARITNASAARDLPFFKGAKTAETGRLQQRLRGFADTMERIQFGERPSIDLELSGDARDLQTLNVRLSVQTPQAHTPWGDVSNGVFRIRMLPASIDRDFGAEIGLDAKHAVTKWGSVDDLSLAADLASPDGATNSVNGKLRLAASNAQTPWATGRNVSVSGSWLHYVTNPVPAWAEAEVTVSDAETRYGTAGMASVHGHMATTNLPSMPSNPGWGWWTNLHPFELELDAHLQRVKTPKVELAKAEISGAWKAPLLKLHSVHAELYDGLVDCSGSLDVNSRLASANAGLDLDLHKVEHLLTEGGRRWLSDYTWGGQPKAAVDAMVILPSWTNKAPDWRGEVLPTLWLSGQFDLARGAGYKGIQAESARSHFVYSNMTWHLTDLVVTRPEGRLQAEHIANDRTREFYWKIHSTVDPTIVRPLLKTNETRVFELLQLTSPPEINAELWGTFHRYDLLGGRAEVAVTNLSFRGQHATTIHASVAYTNKVLQVFNPRVTRGTETAAADGLTADFASQFVYLTNAHGITDPLAIARAIGPKVGRTMEAYVFSSPPKAGAYGVIPMHGELGADLHFDVDGGPFHWWKLHVPQIAGHVHWKGETLTLSDVKADFYSGKAAGKAVFDLSDKPGTDFWFTMAGTNVLLQQLVADLATGRNRSEGRVDGTITVTSANSADWRTVQGFGELRLRDGLLWDIPFFGVLSPVLDGIMPGLGSSRATDGTCTYMLTNGVVRTSDLDIRTTTMRLQYKGDVDLAADYALNARVEAELLKDVWLVGPLVSAALSPVTKVFEYKVTGALGEPKLEPVNIIPKLMLMPFHPLRMFKGLGSNGSSSSQTTTNAPTK